MKTEKITEIKIKGVTYVVSWANNFDDKDTTPFGRIVYTKKQILLDVDIHLDSIKPTLIHEITHAFIWEYGFYQVDMSVEVLCDFLGAYAEDILFLVERVMGKIQ